MHSCRALHFPWRQKQITVCAAWPHLGRERFLCCGFFLMEFYFISSCCVLCLLSPNHSPVPAPPRVSPGDPVYRAGGPVHTALGTFPVWSLSCPPPQQHLLLCKYLKASCTCAQRSAAKFPPSTAGRGHQLIPVTCWDCQWLSPTLSPPLHLQGKGNVPKTLVSLCCGRINSSVTSSPSFLFHPTGLGPGGLCHPVSPSVLCLFQAL